jgi:hypothetical protein
MTTLAMLLSHFGLTALPFDRAVPPEGVLRHASFTEPSSASASPSTAAAPACSSPRPARGNPCCSRPCAWGCRRARSA